MARRIVWFLAGAASATASLVAFAWIAEVRNRSVVVYESQKSPSGEWELGVAEAPATVWRFVPDAPCAVFIRAVSTNGSGTGPWIQLTPWRDIFVRELRWTGSREALVVVWRHSARLPIVPAEYAWEGVRVLIRVE
jgi:hypothetical protein